MHLIVRRNKAKVKEAGAVSFGKVRSTSSASVGHDTSFVDTMFVLVSLCGSALLRERIKVFRCAPKNIVDYTFSSEYLSTRFVRHIRLGRLYINDRVFLLLLK